MHDVRIGSRGRGIPVLNRRTIAVRAAQVVGGAALTVALVGFGWAAPVAAQDDTIVLTAGGSTLTVSPGNASAVSAVAEAHASPGHAETIAAAARAVADCEDGAMTEAAAALAVAHPDQGALTESLASQIIAEAKNNRDGDPIRKVVEDKCKKDEKEEKKAPPKKEPAPEPAPPVVIEVPETGVGMAGSSVLSSLLGAASVAAALGAVALRRRDDLGELALPAIIAGQLPGRDR
jgi:outer membrane biosynthesis protein TonB